MADVHIEQLVKTYGKVKAVDNVSLSVRDGEFVTLLGPSGCGKTTLLRAIAGLGDIDNGRILIGGRDVTYSPPKNRNISMVFQGFALFPHMKVYDNIAFSVKMKRVGKDEARRRVQAAAEMLHIEDLLERYPAKLSGGQRQRVAVARAVAGQAQVMLMDEPLSNLDILLRVEMRAELKRLMARLRTTTIYVTHDQTEALTMGEQIAIMRDGQLLQFDSPTTVYNMPVDQFVGGFLGNPPMNFIEGQLRLENNRRCLLVGSSGNFAVCALPEMNEALAVYDGQPVVVGIRAESIEALHSPAPDALPVKVVLVEPLGAQNLLSIQVGQDILKVTTRADFRTAENQDIWVRFPSEKLRWFDRDTGRAIVPDLGKLANHMHSDV